ncbi:MAG TPA: GNAT family N-acetyltransferase [Acidimicrobiales bacterium]|nr:GNAT family N-acetyltransferase [Acidimicrobiales bacterium]
MQLRPATVRDIGHIASIQARNWQRVYAGTYDQGYLDDEVERDRLEVWTDRIARPEPTFDTTVADDGTGTVVGYVHAVVDHDRRWGTLVDSLHVAEDHARQGIGRALMRHAADLVANRGRSPALHLWVLDDNVAAQVFYTALGGERLDSELQPAPRDQEAVAVRYVWRRAADLLA